MTFAAPLGLLALLAIPAIVAIHLLRRRFPVRPIAGLFLWQVAHDVPDGGRRIDKLPFTASLLLECLAALALALIISGATLAPSASTEHIVVLLDDSVSMTAVDSGGGSPRARAIRRVQDEVKRIGPRGRITLVRSGERPALIAGPAAFGAEAESALSAWTPQARQHSLAGGQRLARELAGDSGSLLVLSDRRPDGTSERIIPGESWAATGVPLANIGIVDAHRSVNEDTKQGALSLTVRNYSDAAARRVLVVSTVVSGLSRPKDAASDKQLLTRNVDVPPGTSNISIPLRAATPPIRASLSDDALLSDNGVVMVEPRPQIVAVDDRLKEGRGKAALEKALGALAGVVQGSPGHLAFLDAVGAGADLKVGPAPGVWQARFGRPEAPLIAAGTPEDLIGPFVLEKRHPLLQGVTLGGVVWTGVVPLSPGAVHPLTSGGERALIGTLAPTAGSTDPAFLFNLDLERTNLIRSPDWPILISNLVEMRRRELPGPERWNYRVGEWVRIRFDRPPTAPLRLRMGTFERDLPGTRLVEFVAPAPGGLAQILEGDQLRFEIGINPLDEPEGDLRLARTETLGKFDDDSRERAIEAGAGFDPLFWLLLAACAAAMLGNWWLLSPQRVLARPPSPRLRRAGRVSEGGRA
jgi:Ca-activated chloride channel homolog